MLTKLTVIDLYLMKKEGRKITMLTAYDYPTALILDEAGVDIILVGDSLGNVILGYKNTIPVTMDDMVRHCAAVSRGIKRALVVGDMPFMSYATPELAVRNAGRLVQEGGVEAVKLEGGREVASTVKLLVDNGVPVMGHIGLTPQSIYKFGGYKVQGRTAKAAKKLIEDAEILEKAGVFSIVLECIPWKVAKIITESISVPTIGIGAGAYCDGQVLVTYDMLGFFEGFKPKFVKQYCNIRKFIMDAVGKYISEVRSGIYPTVEYSYELPEEEEEKLSRELASLKAKK
ncbi:MAG: 3-methyl-2-oxobutanoate hydroxymethyltransferase [Candidatus Freyarchaeota archaeon]|nr:3-methyl-2-oxobutanoate hydroxymethyltransferase [Candidatus Jordarchaeia archaeon]